MSPIKIAVRNRTFSPFGIEAKCIENLLPFGTRIKMTNIIMPGTIMYIPSCRLFVTMTHL